MPYTYEIRFAPLVFRGDSMLSNSDMMRKMDDVAKYYNLAGEPTAKLFLHNFGGGANSLLFYGATVESQLPPVILILLMTEKPVPEPNLQQMLSSVPDIDFDGRLEMEGRFNVEAMNASMSYYEGVSPLLLME